MQQVASHNAPSPSIVLPHFIFGGLTWLAITLLIVLFPNAFMQHYFNPKLLSITHLLVLGWITMIIFGALYQLIPVIMEVKLYSERLAIASFTFLSSGAVLLAISFWNFWLGTVMHISALLIVTAVSLFAVNIFVTGRRSIKDSIEKDFILTSVIWLLFTVAAGLALAINLTQPFLQTPHLELLKLHAHAGIVGWFIQLIIGVGSKLLPMFMVAHNLNTKKLKLAYYLINTGLIAGIASLYIQWHPGVITGICVVVMGVLSFLSFIYEAYRKRVKRHLDIGMNQSALSFIVLMISLFLILVIEFGFKPFDGFTLPMIIAYGSTLLFGFITSLIMGQTYKTLPFIIWLKVYRQQVGKGKMPLPKDLYSEKIATIQLWCFAVGFFMLLVGILIVNNKMIATSGIILFSSAALYNINIFKIILHKPITYVE